MRRKLLFLATEDWFFRSHFMPLLREAEAQGFEPAVAARWSGADLGGARRIDWPIARGSLNPARMLRDALALRGLVAQERPDIVHAIALKPIMLALIAGLGEVGRVYALTGRGYLALNRSPLAGALSGVAARWLRLALQCERSVLLVENLADRAWIEGGRALPDRRVVVMPGAGVDAGSFLPAPPPADPPFVVGVVARLVRSKGIDVAVEAVRRLRREGLDIELRIAGDADTENPEHVDAHELSAWRAAPGVRLLGRIEDVGGFWAGAHIACLPSLGGEGLPRSLLEAAACGRPIVTTDTPGCGDLVRDGALGLAVPPGDPLSLADALKRLCLDVDMRRAMGEAGRARVLEAYTERHAGRAAAAAWRAVLA